jgi:RNA polymerase sigma-70 factor (ECF subfamily)
MQNEPSSVLDRFRQGDKDSFEVLFRLHQRAVFGWILRIVRDRGAAEDLTLDMFFRIHQAHARFDPAQGFEGWARRIATHAAVDWMRRRKNEVPLPADVASKGIGDPGVTAEIRWKTAQALQRLSPKLRVAALLAVVEERSQKEVAETLGISVTAVKLRVFRALRLLRKNLEGQGIKP